MYTPRDAHALTISRLVLSHIGLAIVMRVYVPSKFLDGIQQQQQQQHSILCNFDNQSLNHPSLFLILLQTSSAITVEVAVKEYI